MYLYTRDTDLWVEYFSQHDEDNRDGIINHDDDRIIDYPKNDVLSINSDDDDLGCAFLPRFRWNIFKKSVLFCTMLNRELNLHT